MNSIFTPLKDRRAIFWRPGDQKRDYGHCCWCLRPFVDEWDSCDCGYSSHGEHLPRHHEELLNYYSDSGDWSRRRDV